MKESLQDGTLSRVPLRAVGVSDKEYSQLPLRVGQESWPPHLAHWLCSPWRETSHTLICIDQQAPWAPEGVANSVRWVSRYRMVAIPPKMWDRASERQKESPPNSKTTEGRPWAGPSVRSPLNLFHQGKCWQLGEERRAGRYPKDHHIPVFIS